MEPRQRHLPGPMHACAMRWRQAALLLLAGLLGLLLGQSARAVPAFARQTGQSCVACHAGGQFPELTPYGRLFKLTGYTMGQSVNPLAAMVVLTNTTTQNSAPDALGNTVNRNGQTLVDTASVFLAGRVSDNIGGFAQYTQQDFQGGQLIADNFDLRYADRRIDGARDLIWGVTLNNNPSNQDVWNSAPAWSAPYMSVNSAQTPYGGLPYGTLLEGKLASQVAGLGAYLYWDKSIYAELTSYQAATGGLSFLTYPNGIGNSANPLDSYLSGSNIYARFAWTHEWGPNNVMLGAFSLNANVVPLDPVSFEPNADLGNTSYNDVGLDAQYQYILAPHTVSVQLRSIQENINDSTGTFTNGPASLSTQFAKASYVYADKYGTSLAYRSVSGSADPGAYTNPTGVPDSTLWTSEFFYMPAQNTRLGIQFNMFTRYLGTASNYDGAGRNASDNNSTYIYLWTAI